MRSAAQFCLSAATAVSLISPASVALAADQCLSELGATRPPFHGATVVFGGVGGQYQGLAGSIGVVLGPKFDHGPMLLSKGALIEAEVGTNGFHIGVGWVPFVLKMRGTYAGNLSRCDGRLARGRMTAPFAGLAVKAIAHRTWNEPLALENQATYLGVALDITILMKFRVGVLRRVDDGSEGWTVVWGIGAGF